MLGICREIFFGVGFCEMVLGDVLGLFGASGFFHPPSHFQGASQCAKLVAMYQLLALKVS